MKFPACAKVNWTLKVVGIRPDGFHALDSLVLPAEVADEIDLEATDDGSIASDTGYGEKCLAVKAARALRAAAGTAAENRGAIIRIVKRIPVGGGLGGGSADAAAVLRGLNGLWNLGFPPERLAEIGAAVGSDVPALVMIQHYGRPVRMRGRGEIVELADWPEEIRGKRMILRNPGVFTSTPEVYRACDGFPRDPAAANDLGTAAVRLHPEIAAALAELRAAGAEYVRMTGSGSTVFGFVRA